jgi:manganese transport protein
VTPQLEHRSLAEVHGSVPIPQAGSWLRRMFAFAGPAYLVSVGYMDPGNWATDLAGGARFGYQLLWVLLMSNLMAVLLQTLSARLGVVTGKDLAQACRDYYPRVLAVPLWLLCEVAIVACDLAEVLGAAIGLKLLFGLPLLIGVLITALDVLLLLALGRLGMRRMEALILTLVLTIGFCFAAEMLLAHPDLAAVLKGLVPRDETGRLTLFARDPSGGLSVLGLRHDSLYIAMGILGATVMPHNLYLHSALVQSRAVGSSVAAKRQACKMNLIDSAIALNCAFFVNAAILVLAAAAFHTSGHAEVARLEDAYQLLAPLLGTAMASTLFAVALLASGQSSTITGTLAGQIVMEGFLRIRIRPWLRRLISRGLAIIPAVAFIAWKGADHVDELLVLSQVVLSLQLSFAVIPLISFTSDRSKMGEFASPLVVTVIASLVALVILGLNANLVAQQMAEWMKSAGPNAGLLTLIVVPVLVALGGTVLYMIAAPFLPKWRPAAALWTRERPQPGELEVGEAALVSGEVPRRTTADAFSHATRVAVALELGAADPPVVAFLRGMRLKPDAQVFLFHVVESAVGRFLGDEGLDEETREDARRLEAIAEELRRQGLRVTAQLGFGDPAAELARLVNEHNADLLLAGAHGHGPLQDLLRGSTTSSLRHRVRCPVLVVPSARPATVPAR